MRGQAVSMLDLMTLANALGCGLIAGFFFAFSFTVMGALGKLPPAHGIAAMQSINVVVLNPMFFAAFFGTALLCLAAIVTAVTRWHDPRAPFWLIAGVLYIVGSIVVTMRFNVPRNNALAALGASTPEAAKLWIDYLSSWTGWNHVRMAASFVASGLYVYAMRLGA